MGPLEPIEFPPEEQTTGDKRRRRARRRRRSWDSHLPLAIFALILGGGSLLFGAVDRWVQIGVVLLLGAGMALQPKLAISRRAWWVILGVAGLLVLAQFAPWHPETKWRLVLGGELRVALPSTHHPEPARALDALLAGVIGVLWFGWVRGLAVDREARVRMFWIMAAVGLAIATVCFAAKGIESGKIYGIRPTLGWVGWGPFPNRNHTASFLAMGALVAAGALFWAMAKRRKLLIFVAAVGFVAIVGALLASKSRGGLVAFGAGIVLFMLLILARNRNRRAWGVVLGLAFTVAALVLTFGGKVLARFTSQEAGAVSNDLRRQIWSDTATMWKDAPVFGHGLETFAQIFPLYTSHDFDGQMVRHSESSWLLWLSEIGAFPLALAAIGILIFCAMGIARAWRNERRSFSLTAGALAGVAALAAHAVIDVPGHRWATAGFALALLAVAFPPRGEVTKSKAIPWVAAAVAAIWLVPFLMAAPWSTRNLAQLEAREEASRSLVPVSQVSRAEWDEALRFFPIDPVARHYAGIAALAARPPDARAAEKHFAVARCLAGSSWGYPMMQARAFGRNYPPQAILAWQDTVDRSGRRSSEILRGAVSETSGFPGFWVLWSQFIERRPALSLAFARALMEEVKADPAQARYYFELWRAQRGALANLPEQEIADFYIVARSFALPGMLTEWMEGHKHRWKTDYKEWVRLLAGWQEPEQAWQTYARVVRAPELGRPPGDTKRPVLESQYRASPENPHIALSLAQHLALEGDMAQAEEVILRHAERPDAPVWFLRKGAHILADRRQFADAVALALREK